MSNKVYVADGAKIIGNVSISEGSSVWYNAVIRGDEAEIKIGKNSNIQDCCVLHTEKDTPLVLGNGVSVGHGAILHSCEVGDNTLIGMGAIVLNRVKIGKDCIVGAGSLVTQNTVIEDGSMWFGSPAKFVRKLTAEETEGNRKNAREYIKLSSNKID